MRLGGFVIHGNSQKTLARCLDSLVAVCDEVLAVDSDSNDGSRELCVARGVRSLTYSWQGPGAARSAAALALEHCDYLFFLDADEWLEPDAVAALRRWRGGASGLPHYTVRRRDWVDTGERRFLFRCETRARVVRRDCATWQPSWIVHEALPHRESASLGMFVEHAFATSPMLLRNKQAPYAFLWAIRANAAGRQPTSGFGRALASTLRDSVVKGALWQGGADGWRMARAVAHYHGLKFEYLRAIHAGAYRVAVEAFAAGRYAELFEMIRSGPPALPDVV